MSDGVIQVVLALDIGSSSIRCGAYEVATKAQVKPLQDCFASCKVRTVEPITGKIELITEHGTSLLEEIDATIDAALLKLRKYPEPTRVVGVGFATFCMNLIALDETGKPVGKEATLSYACSTPAVAEECRWLKSHLGTEREHGLYQRTGAPLHSSYALPQLRELYSKAEYGDIVSRIVVWQSLSSTCLTRWKGTPFSHISYSEASWTGLFNFRTLEWDKEAVSLLPEECKNHMPPLQDYGDDVMPSGGIRPETLGEESVERNPYWDRWPELRGSCGDEGVGCRLFFGLGDGACANIGSKCFTNQKIAVTIGTSAAARVCIPMRPSACMESFYVPEGLFCYRLDRSHLLLGGALTDGGSVVEWARQLLNLEDDDDFANCMVQVEQVLNEEYENCAKDNLSLSAVSLIPFLSGERSIGYRDGANFCVAGMTRNSTSAHFMKACLEGVILRLEAILRLLRQGLAAGKRQPRIVASGSALEKNALWRQMLADCTGQQVQMDTCTRESTSTGVATMVAVALAMKRDMTTESTPYLTRDDHTGQPVYSSPRLPITESYWAVALEDQENLIDAVSSLW